jgi:hypothetical protein
MKRITSSLLAALVCTSASLAVHNASAQTAGTPSQLDQLSAFIGDGKCAGHVMAMEKNPGHASVGHVHGEKTLDGNWIVIHYDEVQTTENKKPYHVVQYFGYDTKKKQFTSVVLDNSGTSYGTGISSGWKDDTFTVDNTTSVDGKNASYRDVFTRKGASELSHAGTMRDKNGKWIKTDEETCQKS